MIQITLCVLFVTNTNNSLPWFLDTEVEKHASNSAEAAYGENTNLNIALYERIFPFKTTDKNLKFVNNNLKMKN